MKIETISVLQRKNLGNYEHIEISATAKVEEGEEAFSSMLSLKTLVQAALEAKAEEVKPSPVEVKPEPVIEEPVKEKKPRTKKEKPVEQETQAPPVAYFKEPSAEVPPVIEQPKEKSKSVVYDSGVTEHKSILAGYLSKKYDTAWKTVAPAEEIKKFTTSLNGQPFLDDSGKILQVFLEQIHTFFGA